MSLRLSHTPHLDHLKQQAKDLQRQWAQHRNAPVALHEVQHLLAREYGEMSWPALVARVRRLSELAQHVRRFQGTFGNAFPALRKSGLVSPELLMEAVRTHPQPEVRCNSHNLIYHLGYGDLCYDVLVSALRDPVPRVRKVALHTLSCTFCAAKAAGAEAACRRSSLIERQELQRLALSDPNERVRIAAVGRLGEIGDADAVPVLNQVLAVAGVSTVMRQVATQAMALLQDRQAASRT